MFGDLPYKALHHTICGETRHEYTVGSYKVTVDFAADPSEAVTFRHDRRFDGGTGSSLVRVEDRTITIDMDELLQMVLEKVDPVDIASALWTNSHEVREAFVDLMAGGSEWGSFDDNDRARQRLLLKMQRTLLSKRLNQVSDLLRTAEYYQKKYWDYYHARFGDQTHAERPEFLPLLVREDDRMVYAPDDPEYKIGSKNWAESSAWWREKLIQVLKLEPDLEPVDIHEAGDGA